MNRRELLHEIAQYFEDDFAVSVEPDLPELFEGPDILAGKPGKLIAVFVPKSREMRDPQRLQSRLILSRLALPEHTQCLLTLPEREHAARIQQLVPDFHALVEYSDRAGFRKQRSKSQELRRIPRDTKLMMERRTAFLMGLSLTHHPQLAAPLHPTGERRDDSDWPPTGLPTNGAHHGTMSLAIAWQAPLLNESMLPKARNLSVSIKDGVMIAGAAVDRGSIHERLSRYVMLATQTAFRVDRGVPYLGNPTAGVFLVREMRRQTGDPLKPIRASAFAGWALLTEQSRPLFIESVHRTAEWLVGKVREYA